jgi:N-acetylglucosaminyldiphosphoundecaprenol N-acetyl-beta-D-mannosaminyltransferase
MRSALVKKDILGIKLTNASLSQVSEYIVDLVKNSKQKCFVVTPNPEMIVYASTHSDAKKVLREADIAICDGIGLYGAAQFLGIHLKERITGVDLMLKLCEEASTQGLSIGLLGGRAGVADRTAECLREKQKNLNVRFTGSDWDIKSFPKNGVDLLFVAYGFPKQEKWISENLPILPVKMAMGVGGAFDYISGEVRRAPFFIRAIGLEWAFRLVREPWRAKRQVKLLNFIGLVIKEKLGLNKSQEDTPDRSVVK